MKTVKEWWKERVQDDKEKYPYGFELAEYVWEAATEEILKTINGLIKSGDLGGNGCDKNAERNGIILAYNTIKLSNKTISPDSACQGKQ